MSALRCGPGVASARLVVRFDSDDGRACVLGIAHSGRRVLAVVSVEVRSGLGIEDEPPAAHAVAVLLAHEDAALACALRRELELAFLDDVRGDAFGERGEFCGTHLARRVGQVSLRVGASIGIHSSGEILVELPDHLHVGRVDGTLAQRRSGGGQLGFHDVAEQGGPVAELGGHGQSRHSGCAIDGEELSQRIGVVRSGLLEAALLDELGQPHVRLRLPRPRHLLVPHQKGETVGRPDVLSVVGRDAARQLLLRSDELGENGVADGAVVTTTTIPCVSPRKHASQYRGPPTKIERVFDLPTCAQVGRIQRRPWLMQRNSNTRKATKLTPTELTCPSVGLSGATMRERRFTM